MIFERIKRLRENEDMTQREIAKILKISKSTYNRWETGDVFIPLKHLNNLCNYYKVSMDYVIGITDKKHFDSACKILDKKLIGERLKEVRTKNNLSQIKLANALNTSHSTISAYEHGKTLLLTVFAYQIATKLNVSLDWLCGRS